MVASSRSGTLSVASSTEMSTTRTMGVLIWIKLPAFGGTDATTPSMGDLTFA